MHGAVAVPNLLYSYNSTHLVCKQMSSSYWIGKLVGCSSMGLLPIVLLGSQNLAIVQFASEAVHGLQCGPVIHGAGGMQIVDPLFQRVLVRECQSQLIPTIFDEVLTGCWRLGVEVCPFVCQNLLLLVTSA
jgi:hypothetical protein